MVGETGEAEECSFLKKRTKKLFSDCSGRKDQHPALKRMKVFLLLFLQKKKILPALDDTPSIRA